MNNTKRVLLNGVPVRIDKEDPRYCGRDCSLLTWIGGTCCALEADKAKAGKLRSRYDRVIDKWRRCPTCLRLMIRAYTDKVKK